VSKGVSKEEVCPGVFVSSHAEHQRVCVGGAMNHIGRRLDEELHGVSTGVLDGGQYEPLRASGLKEEF
jgi:hypothetical protein